MSLVTRCTACGTLFKVVADQLKISEGWVRCGQCAHVFDAQANLADAVAITPQAAAPATASSGQSINATKLIALSANPTKENDSKAFENSTSKEDFFLHQDGQLSSSMPAPSPSIQPPDSLSSGAADSRAFKPGLLRDADEIDSEVGPSTTSWASSEYVSQQPGSMGTAHDEGISLSAEPTTLNPFGASTPQPQGLPYKPSGSTTPEPSTQPQPTPGFVKQAQRSARWRSPWLRAGLSLVTLLLLAVLALQVGLKEKDFISATYPQAKPWLDQLCAQAGCRVEPFKRIESIVIDSSSFNRINKNNPQLEAATQSYKLGVTLKNTGNLAVALPHVELSLQDTQDQPILRRVLSPADLGASLDRLQPAQELAGTLTLQISTAQLAGSRINGYRVLAFYP